MDFDKRRVSEAQSFLSSRWGDFNNFPSQSSTISIGNKSEDNTSKSNANSAYKFRTLRRRVMNKAGQLNIIKKNFSTSDKHRFILDLFYTMVDSKWRWTLITFTIWYILSWLIFAFIWLMISTIHGDLEEDHLPIVQAVNGWKPCIHEIHTFTSCFMFSVEMQTLIYYGVRATTEECPEAIIMTCLQLMVGVISQVFMVGIFFTKMTHSKKRAQTIMFSKYAVICNHNNQHCLLFRVGDMRTSHILSPKIRVRLLKTRTTYEGEKLFQSFNDLKVGTEKHSADIFLNWPTTVIHKIDGDSPLYTVHANNLSKLSFELIVTLEGVIESTGQIVEAKTSYINTEILWGYEFQPITTFNRDTFQYESDFSNFHKTVQAESMTPYSALECDLRF